MKQNLLELNNLNLNLVDEIDNLLTKPIDKYSSTIRTELLNLKREVSYFDTIVDEIKKTF